MSEPENFEENTVKEAFDVLEETGKELEKDINHFQDFIDAVFEKDFSSNHLKNNLATNGNKKESIIDIYREKFYANDTSTPRVDKFADELDLSHAAADLFDELANTGAVDNELAYTIVNNFDSNNVNQIVLQNFEGVAEYPMILREKVDADLEIERESLWHYFKEIENLYNTIDNLNRENTLPMSLDEGLNVVDELEELEERTQQLRARRINEISRRDEYMEGPMDRHEEKFYEDTDFQRPVLEELARINEYVEEARENIVIDF